MILAPWRDGWRRVVAAPAIAVGVFAVTIVFALPLVLVLRETIAAHLGNSLMASRAADGVDWDWWQEFSAHAMGVGSTLTPSVLSPATTLDSVSSVLDGHGPIAPIAWALACYLAGWTFLSGGIIDRYARQRATRSYGFFAAAGTFFFRFARLGVVIGLAYWGLFAYVHPWLFDRLYVSVTRDLGVERAAFTWRVGFYTIVGALLVFVNVLSDYAKVRMVVEDRRSAAGALAAAWRFIRHRPGGVIGLYALNSMTFLGVVAVWALVAPGAGGAGFSMWLLFACTQLYVIARLLVKLQFLASQTSLFQTSLAHASYTAAPEPTWPESAAAEAITRGVLPGQ